MSDTLTVVEELRQNGFVHERRHAEYIFGLKKQPQTWDDASRRATYQIVQSSFKVWDRVSDLRDYIDYLIDVMGPTSEKNIPNNVAAEYWSIFGRTAVNTAEKLGFFTQSPAELIEKISNVLVSKQKDYGPQNIARFGRAGLLVRCHDKIARLENLLGNDKTPVNETVVDNFIDVVGYSAIGIMWERGWFLLPLES